MKIKKKKTKRPSSNPINGSDSSSAFHVSIAATAVAQICHSLGFKSTQTTALQTLTDVTVRYLTAIATSAATSAVITGRTECNLYDVIRGLEEVHADVGFKGNSVVTRRLGESEMLKDLVRFVEWSREMPFAKPLGRVTSSFPMVTSLNERESEGEVVPRGKCSEKVCKKVFTAVNGGESESEAVPRGKEMVTSLSGKSGEKRVITAVNEGEVVPRGKQMVTSLCENEKRNGEKSYRGENETVKEGGEKERKKGVTRGKWMMTSLYGECSNGNEKLNHSGEKRVVTAVNECRTEGEVMPRGKQMLTSLYGECSNGNEMLNRKNYGGEKSAVNEGKTEREVIPREKSEMCHVPKWLPEFPNRGEKEVFTAVVNEEGKKIESDKEKVNYELPEVRKKVRFEIKGGMKRKRVKDVINVKLRGVNLKSGVGGGKRILCQIYQELGKNDVVKNVKMKYARRR